MHEFFFENLRNPARSRRAGLMRQFRSGQLDSIEISFAASDQKQYILNLAARVVARPIHRILRPCVHTHDCVYAAVYTRVLNLAQLCVHVMVSTSHGFNKTTHMTRSSPTAAARTTAAARASMSTSGCRTRGTRSRAGAGWATP